MVEFAGYSMPVQYGGVLAEAKAVRTSAGLFDVGHMARFRITGEKAFDFLQNLVTNNLGKLSDGQGLYSLLCNESGGCIDDIIVYRMSQTDFRLVANASNHEKVARWMAGHQPTGVTIDDQTDATFMIAAQGPSAVDLVCSLISTPDQLRSSGMFGVTEAEFEGEKLFIGRSGYTGEDGVEMIGRADLAPRLWKALMALGAVSCGLASRDTLRVEAGLPLYGHELNDEMSPLCAGLGWAIAKDKPFVGSEMIAEVRASKPPLKLMGIKLESKRLLSGGAEVRVDGQNVGSVSSGVVSPVLDCGIAFAFLDPAVAEGTACEVDIRGQMTPALVTSKRFLKRS